MLLIVQAVSVAVSLYQSAVMLAGRLRKPSPPVPPPLLPSFALLICARNEEAVVEGLIRGLLEQEYPGILREVVLVAHNCDDATAAIGRATGARVIEVTGAPGKAAAMAAGLAGIDDRIDFVGIFDADSRVPPGLLAAVARVSAGEVCLQVETMPRRTNDWLATGYGLGRRARNLFWWRPRERLGLGTTFSGSGYFIPPPLLRELLQGLHTITEDLELTARLYARGQRVTYVSATQIQVEEPHGFGTSLRQRSRWVRGHFGVLRHYGLPLVRQAAAGDIRAFDLGLYLLFPTRVLTRTGVTVSFFLSVLGTPIALPRLPVLLAMGGEWVLPTTIAIRARLVPLSLGGLEAAVRHGLLSLLWFPIGLWALVTPGRRTWEAMPRHPLEESDAYAPNAR